MLRDSIIDIVSKGFIRGECNRATLYYSGRDLKCEYVSDDREVVGVVTAEKFNGGNNFIGNKKVGIPDVDDFLKKVKTLGKEITIETKDEGRNGKFFIMKDNIMTMRYILQPENMLQKFPKFKDQYFDRSPNQLIIDSVFNTRMYKSSGAIKDCKYLFIQSNKEVIYLTLSQKEDFNTGIQFEYELKTHGYEVDPKKFDIKKIRHILNNNSKMDGGILEIHSGGILVIEFYSDLIKNRCYVVNAR